MANIFVIQQMSAPSMAQTYTNPPAIYGFTANVALTGMGSLSQQQQPKMGGAASHVGVAESPKH